MRAVVTGGAGFIGSNLVDALLEDGETVVVLDDLNDYYSPADKRDNLSAAFENPNFHFVTGDIRDRAAVAAAFGRAPIDRVVHLAARAGVQPSLSDPVLYADVNVTGTAMVLEACAAHQVKQVVFGSSSSVYGDNAKIPFTEVDPVEHPLSPYAATKRANELQCWTFHRASGIPITCLRFFTAYGPRNRPDMAVYKFGRAIVEGRVIQLFGTDTRRDFTYVGDIVRGLRAALTHPNEYLVCNLGRGEPVRVDDVIEGLEAALDKKARVLRAPLPAGDMAITWADGRLAREKLGWAPTVDLTEGLGRFASWLTDVSRSAKEAG